MSTALKRDAVESSPDYWELYKRNLPIITLQQQKSIRELKIAVAGCGSTGGAVVDGAVRLGIETYHLADNGAYELNNLNRQMVFLESLNKKKSAVHSERILSVNPAATVRCWNDGVNKLNLAEFLSGVDFVFDAVDVTTQQGMAMKLELHRAAFDAKLPVGSALDLGYTQWLQSYNYQLGEPLLKGNYNRARECQHPMKALIAGFSPVEDLPLEIVVEVLRLIKNPNESACQLACACFVLSAMMTPYLLYLTDTGALPALTKIDLLKYFQQDEVYKEREDQAKTLRVELEKVLANLK